MTPTKDGELIPHTYIIHLSTSSIYTHNFYKEILVGDIFSYSRVKDVLIAEQLGHSITTENNSPTI